MTQKKNDIDNKARDIQLGFCSFLAILASENIWALEAQRKLIHKTKLSLSM